MPEESKEENIFTIFFAGSVKLKTSQIWPDGDAPENPKTKDVISLIEGLYQDKGEFISDWSLSKSFDCIITHPGDTSGMLGI